MPRNIYHADGRVTHGFGDDVPGVPETDPGRLDRSEGYFDSKGVAHAGSVMEMADLRSIGREELFAAGAALGQQAMDSIVAQAATDPTADAEAKGRAEFHDILRQVALQRSGEALEALGRAFDGDVAAKAAQTPEQMVREAMVDIAVSRQAIRWLVEVMQRGDE